MKIHKEGYKILRNQSLFIIITVLVVKSGFILNILLSLEFILLILSLNFFRIPERIFEYKDGLIYSPCDGKVVVIEETNENEYFKDNKIQISIFMSPLNIHNNLYPISGIIKYTKYHHGKFLVAWNPKSSTDNERSTVVIKNKKIEILCRQIAGAVARRIVTYAKENISVSACEELGFIKFGSRVDVFLPKGTKIIAKLNQKVKGGLSVIAEY
ncbi:phosphatidylserine decarboxylase family protein [Flavobacteriales bacterium]|nr:phosphatidylserine decarboxylase family protein [Flavobacteriales bacterium]